MMDNMRSRKRVISIYTASKSIILIYILIILIFILTYSRIGFILKMVKGRKIPTQLEKIEKEESLMLLFKHIYPAELEHYNYDRLETGLDLLRKIEHI